MTATMLYSNVLQLPLHGVAVKLNYRIQLMLLLLLHGVDVGQTYSVQSDLLL